MVGTKQKIWNNKTELSLLNIIFLKKCINSTDLSKIMRISQGHISKKISYFIKLGIVNQNVCKLQYNKKLTYLTEKGIELINLTNQYYSKLNEIRKIQENINNLIKD